MTQLDLSPLQSATGSGDSAEPALLAFPDAAPRQVPARALGAPGADSRANRTGTTSRENFR